jgi:hypothetical protein
LWMPNGSEVSVMNQEQLSPVVAGGSAGDVIVAWADQRCGIGQIHAERMSAGGSWGNPEPVLTSIVDTPGDQGKSVTVRWTVRIVPANLTATRFSATISVRGRRWRGLPTTAAVPTPPVRRRWMIPRAHSPGHRISKCEGTSPRRWRRPMLSPGARATTHRRPLPFSAFKAWAEPSRCTGIRLRPRLRQLYDLRERCSRTARLRVVLFRRHRGHHVHHVLEPALHRPVLVGC